MSFAIRRGETDVFELVLLSKTYSWSCRSTTALNGVLCFMNSSTAVMESGRTASILGSSTLWRLYMTNLLVLELCTQHTVFHFAVNLLYTHIRHILQCFTDGSWSLPHLTYPLFLAHSARGSCKVIGWCSRNKAVFIPLKYLGILFERSWTWGKVKPSWREIVLRWRTQTRLIPS